MADDGQTADEREEAEALAAEEEFVRQAEEQEDADAVKRQHKVR